MTAANCLELPQSEGQQYFKLLQETQRIWRQGNA